MERRETTNKHKPYQVVNSKKYGETKEDSVLGRGVGSADIRSGVRRCTSGNMSNYFHPATLIVLILKKGLAL